jgi:hypothetical protein
VSAGATRGRRRPAARLRFLALVAIGAALFALGVALGEALHDNPKPGVTTTQVTTVSP